MDKTPAHLEHITGNGVWTGPQLAGRQDWIHHLSDDAIAELDAAMRTALARGLETPFAKEDFPLPTVSRFLDEVPRLLEGGLGFLLIRGIPRHRYTAAQCEILYWGIGVHLGRPVSQNSRGHVLGHVRDEGKSLADGNVRPYQTSAKMDFHSDQLPVDILGLFCVRKAKSGGASSLVSALAAHNVMLAERPDLLEQLYQPFNLDWRGEETPGAQPWYRLPMFSYHDGRVTSRITSRVFFESVTRHDPALALSGQQREALDTLQEVANRPELRLTMMFEEGDIQLLNNHMILHARDAYEDYDAPNMKRHLLRMWIALPKERARPLSPLLAERYGYVEAGGIPKKVQ